jgi:hypothetical protein
MRSQGAIASAGARNPRTREQNRPTLFLKSAASLTSRLVLGNSKYRLASSDKGSLRGEKI